MSDMSLDTLAEAPGVTFAFFRKSKCHSQKTDISPETRAEGPGVTFAFSGKSKFHFAWVYELISVICYLVNDLKDLWQSNLSLTGHHFGQILAAKGYSKAWAAITLTITQFTTVSGICFFRNKQK